MKIRPIRFLFAQVASVLAALAIAQFCWGQGNTATTRTNNPDGSTTVTTTTTYSDGSTTTETTYDKDGYDAGTVRTDVQTKDGETTTTITRYDGNGHEIGKTVTRTDKDGNTTVTSYDANGHQTDTSTLPPFKYKPDWKIGLDYKVPPDWRYLPKQNTENQNSANPAPPKAGTTRVSNADGTTITTVNIFSDGWIITVTKYDKDGHDIGTTRTDVQTKEGQTTTTTTKWDGNGHETGKTIERGEAHGSKIIITYDGKGNETGRKTIPKGQEPATSAGQNQASSQSRVDALRSGGVTPSPGQEFKQTIEGMSVRHTFYCDEQQQHGRGEAGKDFQPVEEQLKRGCDQLRKQAQEKKQIPQPQGPSTPTAVGLVIPAQATGQISGIVTTDPKRYQGIPGLQVINAIVPLQKGSDGKPSLQNLKVDTGDHVLQPADEGITFKVPASGTVMRSGGTMEISGREITLLPSGNREAVSQIVVRARPDAESSKPAPYSVDLKGGPVLTTSPACLPNNVTAVHGAGRFSGDANKLLVSFAGEAVTPIAASKDVFFFQVPATAHEGASDLVFADEGPNGWFAASTTVRVYQLQTGIANPNLHRGLRTTGTVGFRGGLKKPEATSGVDAQPLTTPYATNVFYDPDLINLAEIQKQVPDFHLPQPGQQGFTLLSIQNRTPGIISIDGFKGATRSWYLSDDSLPFNTQLGIKAIADGGFDIGVIAQPFYPPVRFEEYQLPNQAQIVPQEKPKPPAAPKPEPEPVPVSVSPPPPEPPLPGCKIVDQTALKPYCHNGVVVNVEAFLWECPPAGDYLVTTVETTTIAACTPGMPQVPPKPPKPPK
jgi:hypothetical protein